MRWVAAFCLVVLLAWSLLATGCRCASDLKDRADELEPLAPLEAKTAQLRLPVEGYDASMVGVPLGAAEPRPIVIVLHGDAERPEPHCEAWRAITAGQVFVLCPRGVALPGQPSGEQLYTFDDPDKMQAELRASLTALKQRFGRHVAAGAVVLVGVGESGKYVLDVMLQDPLFFSRIVLIGGKQDTWSATAAANFGPRGGQRILFACRSAACKKNAVRNLLFADKAGTSAKLVEAPAGARASYTAALTEQWPWLTEGDPRFQPSAK